MSARRRRHHLRHDGHARAHALLSLDDDKIARLMALDAKTEKASLEVLTAEQRKRLDAALGAPVAFRQAYLDRQHQMSN